MPASPEEFSSERVCSLVESRQAGQTLNTENDTRATEFTIAPSTIKAWQHWLAADLVSQWRSLPTEEWPLATIFQELNPSITRNNSPLLDALAKSNTDNGSFVDALNIEAQKLYQQQIKYFNKNVILRWLIPATANLANQLTKSISCYQLQLEINLDNLRSSIHQKQQIYFYLLKSAGTKTAFAQLICLSEELQSLAKEYELHWQECLYKSNASQHSFENLSAQISHLLEFSKQQKADAALNALRLTYQYQLQAQLYNVAGQLLRELETQVQQHILILTHVDLYLDQLQLKYAQQYPLSPMPADFLKHYLSPRINALELLDEIEQWVGSSRYEWVNLNEIDSLRLKQEILIRLQPVCWDFYTECFQVRKKLSSSDFSNEET